MTLDIIQNLKQINKRRALDFCSFSFVFSHTDIFENNYENINEIQVGILEQFLQLSWLIKQRLIKCQMCLAFIFGRHDLRQDDHLQRL